MQQSSYPHIKRSGSARALQFAGYSGAVLLILWAFVPIAHAPLIGNVHLFADGTGPGLWLLVGGVIAAVFTYIRIFPAVSLVGLLAGYLLVYVYVNTVLVVETFNKNMEHHAYGKIARALTELEWGWGVVLLGAILLFSTVLMDIMQKPSR